jgi:hypothetical protein
MPATRLMPLPIFRPNLTLIVFVDPVCLDPGCGGTAWLHCHCGGDYCGCGLKGGMPCPGCNDCDPDVFAAPTPNGQIDFDDEDDEDEDEDAEDDSDEEEDEDDYEDDEY